MATISSYVSDEIYENIKEVALSNNISVSKVIKSALDGITIRDRSIELEILYHLNRIGNNLNQISKIANINKFVDKQTLKSLVRIEKSLGLVGIEKSLKDLEC